MTKAQKKHQLEGQRLELITRWLATGALLAVVWLWCSCGGFYGLTMEQAITVPYIAGIALGLWISWLARK